MKHITPAWSTANTITGRPISILPSRHPHLHPTPARTASGSEGQLLSNDGALEAPRDAAPPPHGRNAPSEQILPLGFGNPILNVYRGMPTSFNPDSEASCAARPASKRSSPAVAFNPAHVYHISSLVRLSWIFVFATTASSLSPSHPRLRGIGPTINWLVGPDLGSRRCFPGFARYGRRSIVWASCQCKRICHGKFPHSIQSSRGRGLTEESMPDSRSGRSREVLTSSSVLSRYDLITHLE